MLTETCGSLIQRNMPLKYTIFTPGFTEVLVRTDCLKVYCTFHAIIKAFELSGRLYISGVLFPATSSVLRLDKKHSLHVCYWVLGQLF